MSKAKTATLRKSGASRRNRVSAAGQVDPLWYRNAVIYQLHVRSFCDSNGDGIGDFNGLVGRLDYLEQLGVTAIWLLPFYPSPLKDDGYDIASYTEVHPAYGTIDQARHLIEEAHRRQIRVITELVINHTSDQHEWFQRARRAKAGSPEREFYVWSDSSDKYRGTRIIFKDFEPSNWSWDRVAGQYYWHRFYSHQPDLNFDNPRVHDAVLQACDFWMKAGVDGVRLDAIPYLYEREGTSCENLPETHAFLKKLRSHVDRRFPGRMLLAEANQWPEDAIAYFGEGDECNMAFHFPLMPRLFMALRMEDRYPIIDILEQTPPIPANCQWAVFLRNHDELTLEMVTDEERDYMYRVYAADREARINLGIRRRLAPLLGNNRRKIELMNALLFSLPGTPVLYYGDEIGMGDNIYLGDRNGVRTPMQWSADRNAGFSRANPQKLFLPVIIDSEYHYETVNVESQLSNPSSLLWWMKRLIALRKRHPVFGRGDIQFLTPTNAKVLVYIRRDEEQQVLVLANLSRYVQPVELDLPEYAGATPVEMFGRIRFPSIGEDGRYFLSIGPHSFYWFMLEPRSPQALAETPATPEIRIDASGRSLVHSTAFNRALERILPQLMPTKRWFVSKARSISSVSVIEHLPMRESGQELSSQRAMLLANVDFNEGEPEVYALPIAAAPEEVWKAAPRPENSVFMHLIDANQQRWVVFDGMYDEQFVRHLLQLALRGRSISGSRLGMVGRRIGPKLAVDAASLPVSLPQREQSNTNAVFGQDLILKLYRRVGEEQNPELEIGEHLTSRTHFEHTAALEGAIETVASRGGSSRTLAVVMRYVQNEGDAWTAFFDNAQRYLERLDALVEAEDALAPPADDGINATEDPPAAVVALIGDPLEWTRLLGRRTAEMHAALADDRGNPAFTPEAFGPTYQRSLLQSMRNTTRAAMHALGQHVTKLNGEVRTQAQALLSREKEILNFFRRLTSRSIQALRIRCHGDYHLGQVLWTGRDFVIIDFEGEPLRSVGERRLKRVPFRDVAGMLRSFGYAAWSALRRHWELLHPEDGASAPTVERHQRGAAVWSAWLGREFVRAYVAQLRESKPELVPTDPNDISLLLRIWLLEKALYEISYELNSRPEWVEIPLRAAIEILDDSDARR